MRIQDKSGELLRLEQLRGVRGAGTDPSTKQAAQPTAPVARVDRVQISDAGRAMAAQTPQSGTQEAYAGLAPERAADIRRRVLEGAYNSLGVVDQVARRMLERGDV